jgi:hypothetical protein
MFITNRYNIFILSILLLSLFFYKEITENKTIILVRITEIIVILYVSLYNKYYGLFVCILILFIHNMNIVEGLTDHLWGYDDKGNMKYKESQNYLLKLYNYDAYEYNENILQKYPFFPYENSSKKNLINLKGVSGPKGPMGEIGPMGPMGPTGPTGPTSATSP